MIEMLKGFPENVAAYACHGHVTKADYDTVLMPDVADRFSRHEKLRIYYEVAPDFDAMKLAQATLTRPENMIPLIGNYKPGMTASILDTNTAEALTFGNGVCIYHFAALDAAQEDALKDGAFWVPKRSR